MYSRKHLTKRKKTWHTILSKDDDNKKRKTKGQNYLCKNSIHILLFEKKENTKNTSE